MKLTYRPEIDGLRAIAVSSVILYHGQITIFGYQPFKGGFIGVDIFFVISGYLITSIILKELVTTGLFSFKYFYERRIRRILPVLLFVILASLPFAWMYLLPDSFIDFSKSILYSLGFSSNFYFHYSGQQYGAIDGWFKPFLHTWSLSVEEQYYILFPIVLLITFKYFRKYLIHILIFSFIVSLGLADWTSRNYSSASFYFLHTRMWELLAGSILAYFEITNGYRSKNTTLNLILPTIGLLLIGHSILSFNDKILHPSFYTLSPIIGVCLIIWFSDKNEIITKILSTKLFVGIGLISYSLYLWHYPIFVFSKIINLSDGKITIKLLLIILLFALSFLTFNYIEKPFRNKKYNFKIIFNSITICFISLLFINFTFIFNNGFKNRFPEILTKNQILKPWELLVEDHGDICFGKSIQCRFGSNSDKKIYLIGDSHMASISYGLKEILVRNNYQLIVSTSGFFCFKGFDVVSLENNEIDKFCINQLDTFRKNLPQEKNSIIIFGGRFPLYLNNSYFNNFEGGIENQKMKYKYISKDNYSSLSDSFNTEVLRLSKNNKIIIVYPIPEVGWHVPPRLKNLILKDKRLLVKSNFSKEKFVTTSFDVFKERSKSSFKLLDSIQGENIYRVYPHTLFCDTTIKDRCVTHDDKNIFYADDDHPSLKGAEMINDLIMKEIEKIKLKSN
jgi:peptidoglycan/LPS O-acetylase OafA/YrhL